MHALNALSTRAATPFFPKDDTKFYISTHLPSCPFERNIHFYSNNAVAFEQREALSHSTDRRRL